MEWISYSRLAADLVTWAQELPPFDFIVGVPRSGTLVASMLGCHRHRPVVSLEGYLEGAMQDITASKILTKVERTVLRRVVEGMGNKQIAYALDRSVRTVEDHRSHIMQKLQADNLVELVQKAKSLRPEA